MTIRNLGLPTPEGPIFSEGVTIAPVPSRGPERPMRRPWERAGTLIKDLPVQAPDQLAALCEDRLARQLARLGRWDPGECGRTWVVSDTNHMTLSFVASPAVEPYVQFLSSPMEGTIFWEVASAQYLPALEDLLTKARTESLQARGFSLGKTPSNFRREVVIDSPEAARRVARETLDILFHTFGYRGPQPLRYQFVADRVAASMPVHTGLTARQLAFVLRGLGFSVLAVEDRPGKAHGVRAQRGSLIFDADLEGPVGKGRYREKLALSCRFVRHPNATLESANVFNAQFGPARALIVEGCLMLQCVLPLARGVTEEYLRAALWCFTDNMYDLDVLVSGGLVGPGVEGLRPN